MATLEATVVAVTPQASGLPIFTELGAASFTRLIVLRELGGAGLTTVSCPVDLLDPICKSRLRDLTQQPSELWVRRNGVLIAAGPINGCQIDKQRELTITAPGLRTYLRYWLRDTDYSATSVDLATVVKSLVDTWQALPYGNDGLDTSAIVATGVTLSNYTVSRLDGKFIDALLTDLGQRTSGFDLEVDPASRQIKLWAPRKGSDRSATVVLDRRSIGDIEIAWSAAPGQVGSEVFATASSATGVSLVSVQSNLPLRASFGRSYVPRTFTDIADQAALDDAATRAITNTSTQPFIVSPDLLPVSGFGFADFDTGDLIAYNYDAGVGSQAFTLRVSTIETDFTDGNEELKVGFL